MIGGNTTAIVQAYVTTKNEIGEQVKAWHDVAELTGWLDLSGGDSKYTTYNAKIQESSHVFICDYTPILGDIIINGKTVSVSAETARIVVNSKQYDIMLIDNPMGLNKHLEIFLKYTGGQ